MSEYETLGFVPVEEIQNVFVMEMSKIEEDMRRHGVPSNPTLVIEWLDAVRLILMQRARFNIHEYVRRNPQLKAKMVEKKDTEEKSREQKTWEDRRAIRRQASPGL